MNIDYRFRFSVPYKSILHQMYRVICPGTRLLVDHARLNEMVDERLTYVARRCLTRAGPSSEYTIDCSCMLSSMEARMLALRFVRDLGRAEGTDDVTLTRIGDEPETIVDLVFPPDWT